MRRRLINKKVFSNISGRRGTVIKEYYSDNPFHSIYIVEFPDGSQMLHRGTEVTKINYELNHN